MVFYRIGKKSNKLKLVHKNRLDRMHELSLKSVKVQKDLLSNFGFNFKDIRMSSFGRIATVLDSRRVSYLMISEFQNKKLSQKKYRNKIFDSKLPLYGGLDTMYLNSMGDLKRGFFLDIFQTFESALRLLNIALGNNNVSGLYSILKNIIQKTGLSSSQKKRAYELLEFISIHRNSIHNNGIYFPIHNSRTITFPINYRGSAYSFYDNQKIFLNFEIIFNVTEDIIEVLEYIIKDNRLNSYVVTSSFVVTPTSYKDIFIEDRTV